MSNKTCVTLITHPCEETINTHFKTNEMVDHVMANRPIEEKEIVKDVCNNMKDLSHDKLATFLAMTDKKSYSGSNARIFNHLLDDVIETCKTNKSDDARSNLESLIQNASGYYFEKVAPSRKEDQAFLQQKLTNDCLKTMERYTRCEGDICFTERFKPFFYTEDKTTIVIVSEKDNVIITEYQTISDPDTSTTLKEAQKKIPPMKASAVTNVLETTILGQFIIPLEQLIEVVAMGKLNPITNKPFSELSMTALRSKFRIEIACYSHYIAYLSDNLK